MLFRSLFNVKELPFLLLLSSYLLPLHCLLFVAFFLPNILHSMSSSPSPNEASYESDEEEKSANITLKRIRILSHHIPQESCLTNPHTSIMQPNDDERKLAATEDRTVDQDASINPEVMHDNDPIFEYPGTTETRLRSSFASTSTSTTGKRKRITEDLIDVRDNENDNIPHNVNAEYWQNLLARSQISLGQRQLDLVATASHSDAVATATAPVNAEGPEEQFARINVPRLRALQYALTHPERQNEDSGSIPSGDRKSTRLNSSHVSQSRMPSSA